MFLGIFRHAETRFDPLYWSVNFQKIMTETIRSNSRTLRRPLLGAALAGTALSLLGLPMAASAQRSRAVQEEEIEPGRYRNSPQVRAFIERMATEHSYDRSVLDGIFATTVYSATVARLIMPAASPARKNWGVYRSRFVEPIRINAGVRFWQQHEGTLRRAEAEYGVPADIIVGIIGVETIYGRDTGNFRVMDSLSTLAFDYPETPNRESRSKMFLGQLEDFLLWCRESRMDPFSVLGSYAGAIGIPQFMPASIRAYATDYDADGRIDLRNSPTDAIGSVARFLQLHGWEKGRPVVWKIADDEGSRGVAAAGADGEPYPNHTLDRFITAGLRLNEPVDVRAEAQTSVLVVDLPSPNRPVEYKLGLRNFYVLTRYNRSFFYAQAVYDLGQAVKNTLRG